MSLKNVKMAALKRQQEIAKARVEDAKYRAIEKQCAHLSKLPEDIRAAIEDAEHASDEASDKLAKACEACPNADICIASFRNACPVHTRSLVAARKLADLKMRHECRVCSSCRFFDEEECVCEKHNKVVEHDFDACEDFGIFLLFCETPQDPDPLWYPNRPLTDKEKKWREESHRQHAKETAELKRKDPKVYAELKLMSPEHYEKLEAEFPDLFGGGGGDK